ncbi:restriction endonuclease subunit S [Flavivirga spongiicola]|uniref:Restriction endonuclease subunit S n=1 Tax=Flavivirga spongiicola TaxID=421621 RepID=A0ABU7XU74_9FLAO|nr:restriction endonuclease subunit S [Flavivirga sp. MEBiC05379]MDO5978989.1 restriction endonuclease subunit S [Flavivirga sp. MEBiC05379]
MSLIHKVEDLFEERTGLVSAHQNWALIPLSDLVKIQNGFAFKSKDFNKEGDGIPLIRIRDILKGKTQTYYKGDYSNDYVVNKGDLLVGMDGDFNSDLWKGKNALLNQRVCRIFPNEKFLMKKLLYYGLPGYLNIINENTSATTVKHLSSKSIYNIPFPIPPIKEQQRIVKKLDTFFTQLEEIKIRLDKIPDLLKNFRQAVLSKAVTGKLTEGWRKDKTLENANDWRKKIIEERKKLGLPKRTPGLVFENVSQPYQVPKIWSFGYLQNFGEFTRGKSKHRPRNDQRLFGGNYPFIQTGDVARSNGLIENHTQTYSEFGLSQSRLFPKGTLCITIAANIAETGILDFDSCFPDSVVGYLPYKGMYSSKFAMYYLRTIQRDLEHYAPATAQKNINLGILFKIAFPVPPKLEQDEIVKRVDNLFSKANAIEKEYETLIKKIDYLPQAILQKAFKGELVEQLPTDGDAKGLLEEIKKLKKEGEKTTKKKPKKSEKKQLIGKSESKTTTSGTLTSKEIILKGTDAVFEHLKKKFTHNKFTFEEIQIPSNYSYDEFRLLLFRLLDHQKSNINECKLKMIYDGDILYFQIPK